MELPVGNGRGTSTPPLRLQNISLSILNCVTTTAAKPPPHRHPTGSPTSNQKMTPEYWRSGFLIVILEPESRPRTLDGRNRRDRSHPHREPGSRPDPQARERRKTGNGCSIRTLPMRRLEQPVDRDIARRRGRWRMRKREENERRVERMWGKKGCCGRCGRVLPSPTAVRRQRNASVDEIGGRMVHGILDRLGDLGLEEFNKTLADEIKRMWEDLH
ncbi:hypothetical protein BDN70DRAFT_998029 [Pholiota conissans]|uniref:Uncharacterized protein n=1 Tax=Pholiota conissans TaxID=109636 RepID=A0A9P6CND5_9AGAR|nr:hypothetical protein BDN70DRAFT_998029 [Pholiota conissans]